MADPGSGFSSGAISGMGGRGLSETEIDRDIGRQIALGPTREFDAQAWYGEDETYGTQGDWLTGEGLSEAWGQGKVSAYPSYPNQVVERIATHPAMNMLVNAEGMLRRGGGPGPWDYAALGLSAIPGGSWALRTARPYVKNILRSMRHPKPRPVESPVTRLPTFDDVWGHRNTSIRKADDLAYDVAKQVNVRNIPAAEFNAMDVRIQERLLKNSNLSRSDIQLVHYVNTERQAGIDLIGGLEARISQSWHKAEREANTRIRETIDRIRSKIKAVDDKIKNLSVAEQKRIGIYDPYGSNALKVWRENQTKVALKPAYMDNMEWATLVKGKTLEEVKDIARKLTLRIVD